MPMPAERPVTHTKRPRSVGPAAVRCCDVAGDYFAITILITSEVPPSDVTFA